MGFVLNHMPKLIVQNFEILFDPNLLYAQVGQIGFWSFFTNKLQLIPMNNRQEVRILRIEFDYNTRSVWLRQNEWHHLYARAPAVHCKHPMSVLTSEVTHSALIAHFAFHLPRHIHFKNSSLRNPFTKDQMFQQESGQISLRFIDLPPHTFKIFVKFLCRKSLQAKMLQLLM